MLTITTGGPCACCFIYMPSFVPYIFHKYHESTVSGRVLVYVCGRRGVVTAGLSWTGALLSVAAGFEPLSVCVVSADGRRRRRGHRSAARGRPSAGRERLRHAARHPPAGGDGAAGAVPQHDAASPARPAAGRLAGQYGRTVGSLRPGPPGAGGGLASVPLQFAARL